MDGQHDAVAVVATLRDPVRARLYAFIRRQPQPVTRDAGAAAAGISRKLAAFHLDKLVAVGLLTADYPAPTGRRGPGRVPKAYTPTPAEWQVSVPPRRYPLLAEVLTAALTEIGQPARAAVGRVAADTGRQLGQRVRADRRLGRLGPERALAVTAEVLDNGGYEPHPGAGRITLRNCPFAQLATSAPDLVCTLNHDLITGLLDGLGASPPLYAALVPAQRGCCVQVRTGGPAAPPNERTDAA